MNESVLNACKTASAQWQAAFNTQNAQGCTQQYEAGATMVAKPFGTFVGHEQIQQLWQNIIDQGFADVAYQEVSWTPEGNDGYILSAKWTMNKAFGVVHKEHWRLQANGQAKLSFDEFEVLGER